MKNICFFNTVKFWGGGEKLHLEYAIKFEEKGYHVYLVSDKNSTLSEKGKAINLPVFNISAGNLSFLNPLKYFKLFRFFKKEKTDTILFSSSQDFKLGAISSKIAGVRNIVYLRGLATPIRNTVINRILFKHFVTHIVANSLETKRTILTHLKKSIDAETVKVIYHGIDLNIFDNHPGNLCFPVAEKGGGIILGNAGRLTLQKGQHYLIEVANRLKQKGIRFTLFIAGIGEMKSTLEKLIEKYHLQKEVVLLGFVEDMAGFMRSIDIFVLTSCWEGFGYVIVEAMAAGKPTVAFNITSNPEIIIDNETGFLADYPDVEMMSERIELLSRDENLRAKFGKAARERVEKNFQLDDRITELEDYLLTEVDRN